MQLKLRNSNEEVISVSLPNSDVNNNISSNDKNATRLASILGTWTGQTHLKTDVGSYELLAYFVIHFMPDEMRGYGCSLKDCNEERNQVCRMGENYKPKCVDMAESVVDWSDVTAFIYFGARIDVGFPFNKHRAEDTGGWVGPFNVIMAKGDINNDPNIDNTASSTSSSSSNNIKTNQNATVTVDRYVSRYIKSPLTPYLKMPHNCSLLGADDFNKVAGPIAVNSTTKGQYDPDQNMNDKNYDPYHKYLKTCDNGDVQTLLPLFEFDFEQDVNTKKETVQVKVNYKFLTMPGKNDYMYGLYPMVQRRFNKADLGFHISGPYCYGNDPKRGYTFDMNFDTRDPKAMLKIDHGCIEGLPCTPPAAELYNAAGASSSSDGGGGGGGGFMPDVQPNVIPEDDGTTVDFGSSVGFILAIVFLALLSLCMCCMNCRLRRKLKTVTARDDDDHVDNVGNFDNVDAQFEYRGGALEAVIEGEDTTATVDNEMVTCESHAQTNREGDDESAVLDKQKVERGDQLHEGSESEPLIESTENEIV